MEGKLLELQTSVLLEKFGKGNHKPGSGSAAAFQGLLSAQLIRTVISLTNDKKRKTQYEEFLPRLLKIDSEIESRIYPKLAELCEEDSVQFGKYIARLRERDAEPDKQKREEFDRQGLSELMPATEMPLEIAANCLELAKFAVTTFDNGFKSARGDAAVALNGAIGAVRGCLSIVDLNLSKFGCSDWTLRIRSQADQLREEYGVLAESAASKMIQFEKSCRNKSFDKAIIELRSGQWEGITLSYAAIEKVARQVQNILWVYRDMIWTSALPNNELDILKPEVVIESLLGYEFNYATLEKQHDPSGGIYEMAGEIDKGSKKVLVSRAYSKEVQNFTTAHELGHALLHKEMVLHRDRPSDGSDFSNRDYRENQADKFATYFLMPGKQVKNVFQELFLTDKFVIDQNTVFQLREHSISEFRAKCQSLRGLARFLAAAEFFRGRRFKSISAAFGVSVGAMAIRLEELGLVEF